MARCANCGESNPARARFCLACAAPLDPREELQHEVRKIVTVLFCDVTGSTALGEALDPESLRLVLSRYFERAREIIERHGGTVEKFIGDAVMAVFGVPRVHEDDALRAIRAALEVREALLGLNDEVARSLGVRIVIRAGINTGEVVAGSARDGQMLVTGDAVNAAKRLEEAASPGEIVIGDLTERLVRDAVSLLRLDPLVVKGKSEPLPAFQVLEVKGVSGGTPPVLGSAMVGRDSELAELEAIFEGAVRNRTCELATVIGGAGIGKSRLAFEFAGVIGPRARFMVGHCLPYGEGVTFAPLSEMLTQLGGEDLGTSLALELEGEQDAALIVERLSGAVAREGGTASTQETFWAARRLFVALSRRRPLVLVFEDVHWGEPTFLDLVEYLVDLMRDAPMMVLCLARPDLLDERPQWARSRPHASTVELEPLLRDEVETLIAALLPESGVSEDTRARIVDAAEGNPLFIEQMLALASERLDPEERPSIPPTIQALITARLDRLNPEERGLIKAAAVIGPVFSWEAVAELSPPHQREAVGLHLMELSRKQLIRLRDVSFAGSDTFAFCHILIRDAAYETVAKQARADLHQRFAHWLGETVADQMSDHEETVAFHLEQSCRYRRELGSMDERSGRLAARAAELLASAGRRAFTSGDMPAAANLLSRATVLLGEGERASLALLPDLAVALIETGDLPQTDSVLSQAVRVATRVGDGGAHAHARLVQAHLRSKTDRTGAIGEVRNAAGRAIETFGKVGDERGLARAWRLLSLGDFWEWQLVSAEECLKRALVHAERIGDLRERAMIFDWLGRALYYGPTPVRDAIRQCEHIREHADDRVVEATAVAILAGLHAMEGRFAEARALSTRSKCLLEELGAMVKAGHGRSFAAEVEMLAGDAKRAEHDLRWGFDALERIGDRAGALNTAYELAEALYAQQRYDESEVYAGLGIEVLEGADVLTRVAGLSIQAKLSARADRFEEGRKLARRAIELAEPTDGLNMRAHSWLALAEVLRLEGHLDEARGPVEQAVELYGKKGNTVAAADASQLLVAGAAARA